MLLSNFIFFVFWSHKLKLSSCFFVDEGINKEIQKVNLLHLVDKPADICNELARINIVHEIEIDFVLPQAPKGPAVF